MPPGLNADRRSGRSRRGWRTSRSTRRCRPRPGRRRTTAAATWRRCAARPASRAGEPGRAAGAEVPGHDQAAERERCTRCRSTWTRPPRPGTRPAPTRSQRMPELGAAPGPGSPEPGSPSAAGRGGEPRPGPVPVDHQQAEGGQHPEHDEDVEDRGAAQHQLQAVQRQQQPGDAAEQGRAGHPADDPGQHQDRQRARPARPRTASRTGVSPNSHSPTAIIILPSGGCATSSPLRRRPGCGCCRARAASWRS